MEEMFLELPEQILRVITVSKDKVITPIRVYQYSELERLYNAISLRIAKYEKRNGAIGVNIVADLLKQYDLLDSPY